MWSSRPIVRILLLYIVGILLYRYIPGIKDLPTYQFIIASVIFIIPSIYITVNSLPHRFNWVIGITLSFIIMISGILMSSINEVKNADLVKINNNKEFIAQVVDNPIIGRNSVRATVIITKLYDTLGSHNKTKILCYFETNEISSALRYGDMLFIKAKISTPSPPKNPYEFDYKNHLKSGGVFYTSYLNNNSWKLIGYDPPNLIIAAAGRIRQSLLNSLQENGLEGNTYSVAAAILLGYDENMVPELKKDFIMAGAMHILCVSGLHIGIIYLVFTFILSFMANNKVNNLIKGIVLLFIIWAYATITGLSPSILRAGLMLSVFIIGNMIGRSRDSYNTLATSALLILLISPQLLFNVGFQLSYAAVLGILTFHQPLYKLIYIKNKLLDSIWSLTVLSTSAQIATFPIAIYYFHFFPPWYWLTNLVTFPLSFLIIVTGVILVSVIWIPYISVTMGKVLSLLVMSLNYSVGIVKHLPFSGIENIYASFSMLILLYLLIISFFLLFIQKNKRYILPIMALLFSITLLATYHKYAVLSQRRVVVYSINKHSVIEFIDGNKQIIISDSNFIIAKEKFDFHMKTSRSHWGLDSKNIAMPSSDTIIDGMVKFSSNFISHNDFLIYYNKADNQHYTSKEKLFVDYVIVSGRKSVPIIKLKEFIAFNTIIIDPTVPPWEVKSIAEHCNELGIEYYDTRRKGAYVIDLNKQHKKQ